MLSHILFAGVHWVGQFTPKKSDSPRLLEASKSLRALATIQAAEIEETTHEPTFPDVFERRNKDGVLLDEVAIVATGSDAFCLKGFKKAWQKLVEHISLETKLAIPDANFLADLKAQKEAAHKDYKDFLTILMNQVLSEKK